MITFEDLTVRKGGRAILRNCSITLRDGVTGLVAPNGSGKTTLLEALDEPWSRLVSGRLLMDGLPTTPAEWERTRFYLPSAEEVLEPTLTGRDQARVVCRLWRSNASVERIAAACGSADIMDIPVRKCSEGMRQLIAVTLAMSTGARLLLLDEPLSALDPTNKQRVSRALRKWAGTNRSVVMSTHDLANVDQTCRSVVFVHEGRLLTMGEGSLTGRSSQQIYQALYEKGGRI